MRQAVGDIGALLDSELFNDLADDLALDTANSTSEALSLFGYIDPRRQRINQALDEFLNANGRPPVVLWDAMRYAVLSDGKRIRPLLCIMAAELCGATAEHVLPTACALELVHTFGLIHADLPSVDNNELRRNRPSCHIRFGETIALLAGDALYSRAFELLALQAERSGARRAMSALSEISSATGARGMAAGQLEAMMATGKRQDPETLVLIAARRSAALIRAAVVAGAILAGGNTSVIYQLADFGEALGHAFHIVDDILCEIGDRETLGKPARRDRASGKPTYPVLFGLAQSRRLAEEKSSEALHALEGLGDKADPLRWLVQYLFRRDN